MQMFNFLKNKLLLTALACPFAFGAFAQDAKSAAPTMQSTNNLLSILLIVMIVVLTFVIWGMGQVLSSLAKKVLEKNKNKTPILNIALLIVLASLSFTAQAQEATAEVIKEVPNYGGLSATAYYLFVAVIGVQLVVILFLSFYIKGLYNELVPAKVKPEKSASKLKDWWSILDKKIFTKAVSVEKEADILLDHDYDGIKELDNSLPPWWKYGFYITIGISVIYILNFHVFATGKNPLEEYNEEMAQAKIEMAIYEANNKDKIDEENVPMADAAGIMVGKALYEANCVACHLSDGGGIVGPNLTDDYWIHGGSLNDIYRTIKFGYPDKGMQAWGSQFTPKEISEISSFLKTLVGTTPATPKEKEGVLYKDGDLPSTDSTLVETPNSTGK